MRDLVAVSDRDGVAGVTRVGQSCTRLSSALRRGSNQFLAILQPDAAVERRGAVGRRKHGDRRTRGSAALDVGERGERAGVRAGAVTWGTGANEPARLFQGCACSRSASAPPPQSRAERRHSRRERRGATDPLREHLTPAMASRAARRLLLAEPQRDQDGSDTNRGSPHRPWSYGRSGVRPKFKTVLSVTSNRDSRVL